MTTTQSSRIATAQRVAALVKAEPSSHHGSAIAAQMAMRDERDYITSELGLIDGAMRDLWDALHARPDGVPRDKGRDRTDQHDAAQDIADVAIGIAVAAIRTAALAQDVLATGDAR